MKTKWTKEDGSPRKNIYHSYLVREGRLMVKFLGDPMESKYGKGSATHYVYFQVPDDETEYCLSVEPACVDPISNAPKNEWVFVIAEGSKDTPASMHVADGAGPVLPGSEYVQPEAAPQDGPPPMWPDEPPAEPNGHPNSVVGQAVANTIEAVRLLREAGVVVDATPIYSTHFIQASRR
jgi:hypothetical protein